MTDDTSKRKKEHLELSLNAPIGVGSQRQALENKKFRNTYDIIRKKAKSIPVMGNLGAAELVKIKSFDSVKMLIDSIQADAFVIHLNPLQELLQPEGDPNFKGLIKSLRKLIKEVNIPVIVKEVGAGISGTTASILLETGVKGIDVAGAGGTSWAAIEMLRNKSITNDYFWDWGLPTSFCLKENFKLKKDFNFILIGSGGINSSLDAAKAFALGADYVASARTILKQLDKNGIDGVVNLIIEWFVAIKKIMFLTGSMTLKDLQKNKLVRKEFLY
jgi:isopentenyl-diphosphate delta-isomerase